MADAIQKPYSPENSSANHVTSVDEGGVLRLSLDPKARYNALIFPGGEDENGQAISEGGLIHGNQILNVEGQTVTQGVTEFDIRNPGTNDADQVPLIVRFNNGGQTETAVLEPIFTVDGIHIQLGNPRLVNGSVQRNDQGGRTETGTGLAVDQITFVSSSMPASSTSSH
jgi:hypothetical protein